MTQLLATLAELVGKVVATGRASRVRAALVVALVVGLAGAGCQNTTEPAPDTGTDYYPVAVGNFWVYAVVDSVWSRVTTPVPSVVTVSTFQFREAVTEAFTDAAGQPAYRLVRSRRASASAAWRADSVFVLSATPQFVALNRNNTRTLELIFPVRPDKSWNFNAFNNNYSDSIPAQTRRYSLLGQAYTTGGGATGLAAVTYPATVTTANIGAAADNTLVKVLSYQQVFARGVGPVFRVRRYFLPYSYPSGSSQVFPPGSFESGFVRRETLLDYGPR